jgi:sialate O-acetylesterase
VAGINSSLRKKKMRKTLVVLCLLVVCATISYGQNKIKVACIGNSVTYGYLLPDRELNAYPFQLQRLLGERYEVGNFGKSGATLLTKGHRPYVEQEEYKKALEFAADLVVIHLGLNDTDPRNWPNFRDDFVRDYMNLIASFRKVNPKCKIWICRLSPITNRHPRFRSGTHDWYGNIQKSIENIAAHTDVQLIDFEKVLFNRPDLLPDALHPNVEGASILAKTVYSALTGDFEGLQMPLLYSDNMVLQRNIPLPITGTANAGEKVVVKIAKQLLTTTTRCDGKWTVTLAPLAVGEKFTLSISTKSRSLQYKNVVAGEVWLCSGQSNMAFMLQQASTAQKDIPQAANPNIRFFDMKPRWETNAIEWDSTALDSVNRLKYYKPVNWVESSAKTAATFSAVGYYYGKMLADSLGVPVGLILNAVGGSPCESWIDRCTLEYKFPDILTDWTRNDMIQDWVRERATFNMKKSANKLQRHPYEPCYLYESGIIPLAQYPINGVIWYQGESNAHNMKIHETLFPLLVSSWRANWNNERLPFYYVQLSSMNRPSWTRFRDSQRRLMDKVSNIYMAVSSDKGDSLNVHPRDKKEIGERLARWALNKSFQKNSTPSGPLFRSVEFKGNAAYISFDYSRNMHSSDWKNLRTFEAAEMDGLYFPAEAQAIGDKIRLIAKEVQHPRFVRYGWQPFTRANLVNDAELPASTFCSFNDENR